MASVTAAVCTRDRPGLLSGCLQAFRENDFADLEILVVDQSTQAASAEVVSSAAMLDPRIQHIQTPTIGLSKARNIGIARASSKVIAFTDDDCIPSSDWAAAIVREFDAEPDVAAVYGRSLPWTKVWPGERPVAVKADTRRRVFSGRCNPWDVGHGCNMAFRREIFDMVGGFDEVLGPGGSLRNCDDADFTYRMLRSGFSAVYSPDVLVYHRQFRHGEGLWRLERDYGIGAGAFYSKHLRYGDTYVLKLILDRWWKGGALHIIYGILTGRPAHIRLGWYRIAYSALGMWIARTARVSHTGRVFVECPPGGGL